MQPKVLALILNFNGLEDTLECVASVERSDYENLDMLVVDNASSEDPSAALTARFPKLNVIRSDRNLGYAGGNNLGIRWAEARGYDYVFVLNNDAVVDRDAVTRLVEAAENVPTATIVAPKVYFYGRPGVINSCGTSMDWLRLRPRLGLCGQNDRGQCDRLKEAEVLPGSALLLKSGLLEKVGVFDEKFFLVHEDAELCLRNHQRGFKNLLVPSAVVHHKTSSTLSRFPFLTEYYSIRNFLYLAKQRAPCGGRILSAFGLCVLIVKNALRFLSASGLEKEKIRGFFGGIGDFFMNRMGACQINR